MPRDRRLTGIKVIEKMKKAATRRRRFVGMHLVNETTNEMHAERR